MVQTVLTVALVSILLASLWAAREALLLIYISGLIAMGFSPLVRVIERPKTAGGRWRVPRWIAILAIYLAIVGTVILIGLMVIPPLVEQAIALWDRLPYEFDRFQTFLESRRLIKTKITLAEAVQSAPAGSGANAVGTVLVALSTVVEGAFGLITILILSFYLLIEAQAMFDYVIRFVPATRRDDFSSAVRQVVSKVSAWLRAQFLLAAVMGVFTAVGLAIMGVPYFYVIALLAAVGETIPIVGPIVGGIAAVAVALTVSPKLALMVAGYFFLLHEIEANVLVPKVMERRVGVSPVAVLVALLVGGALWGLVGAILAIPSAAILSVVLEEVAHEHDVRIQRVG